MPLQSVLASHNGCAYVQFTRCEYHGYYTNAQMIDSINESDWLWPTGHTGINSVSKFMAVLRTDISRTPAICDPALPTHTTPPGPNNVPCDNNSQLIGASYIINTMLGYDPATFLVKNPDGSVNQLATVANGINNARKPANLNTLQTIVQYYQDNGMVEWNKVISYGMGVPRSDTIVMNHTADVTSYINTFGQTDPYIVFKNPDGTVYQINKTCGNITGTAHALFLPGFIATPIAEGPTLTPDTEQPNQATFRGRVNLTKRATVTVNRSFFIQRASGGTTPMVPAPTYTHTFPSGTTTLQPPLTPLIVRLLTGPTSANPGDQVCMSMTIRPGSGFAQADGTVIPPIGPTSEPSIACTTVVARPYVRTYGYDSFIGISNGSRGTECPGWHDALYKLAIGDTSAQFVNGFAKPGVRTLGAGSQLGLLSLGPVSGFGSAVLRNGPPTSIKGLTFANTGVPNDGGLLTNGYVHCPNDYFGISKTGMTSFGGGAIDVGNAALFPANSGIHRIFKSAGNLTVRGTVPVGVQIIIYTNGNLVVSGNVNYSPGPYASEDLIPSLIVNVHGNMYVSSNVTNLDGSYVVQPQAAPNSGRIFTCTDRTSSPVGAPFQDNTAGRTAMIAQCGSQLTVHGQFVAQAVIMNRTYGSLRYSKAGERPRGTPADLHSCGGVLNLICGSEVFDVTPDLYIGPTALPANTGSTLGSYDYIVSLPPVL